MWNMHNIKYDIFNIAKIHVNYAYKIMRKLQKIIGFEITNDFHYMIMFHFSKLYSVIKHASCVCVYVCVF